MIGTALAAQMRVHGESLRMRAWVTGAIVLFPMVWMAAGMPRGPDAVQLVAWYQLMLAVVCGGILAGWRVAQLPKTRAAEFYLITPVADWQIVGGELAGGMLRTALLVAAAAPVVAGMWAAGWTDAAGAVALVGIPLTGGWLAGIGLATVSYEPLWLRRLLAQLVTAGIIAYLVLFGLVGHYFVPRFFSWWATWTIESEDTLSGSAAALQYVNPFAVLGSMRSAGHAVDGPRVAATIGCLMAVCLVCMWRLVIRLRPHYLAENYAPAITPCGGRAERVGDNPLSWWTARRVSRFRGSINLWLTWAVVVLYGAWLLLGEHWPAWLNNGVLRMIAGLGGEAILAVSAVQLAVVPAAFLTGLWDSNQQQRVKRLELLLTTPLTAWQFLGGSAVAAWTRGRGYALAAVVIVMCAAAAGRYSWSQCLVFTLVAANYSLLVLAIAFRSFARIAGDRAAHALALAMSVGVPLGVLGICSLGWWKLAAATPPGAMFVVALPMADQARLTGLSATSLLVLIAASNAAYLTASLMMLRGALRAFDLEIRTWFAEHLVTAHGA